MRFYADHIATDTNIEYRIEIHDSQFGGTAQKMKGIGSGWLDFSHQKLDPKKPHLNPIQKGSLKVGLWIRTAAEQTLLSDILSSDEQRFTIKYIVDSVEEWEGFVLPDLVRYTEDENPRLTLEAKDFTTLEGVNAPAADVTAYRRLSVLIADCLKLGGLTLPIRSYTNLTHADVTQANDFLHEIYHQRAALENKNGSMTCINALENICRAYNLTIKQSGKRWVIDQLPGVAKGDTTQYDYDSDGLNPVSSSPSRGYIPTKVTIRSDNRRIAALKSLDSVYNHRTLINNIDTEDVTYTFDPAPTYDQFSLSFENEPIYRMYFSTDVEVDADTTSGIEGNAYLTVKGVTSAGFSDQYLTDAGTWSSVEQDIEITMSGPDGSMSGSFEVKDSGNIADAVEEIVITLKWADASLVGGASQTVTEVRWLNTDSHIFNTSIKDFGASIRYRYIRSGNYSVSEDIGTTVLGDGPTQGTNSASNGRPASGSLASTVLDPNRFRIRGVSENVKLEELKLREYINVRRSGVRILSADVIGTFSSENILNYDSESWYVLGDSVDGYTGRHRSEIMALSYDGDTTGDSIEEVEQPLGVSTGQATADIGITKIIEEVTNQKRFDSSQKITTTTADISGTVTSIPIVAVGEQFLALGDIVYLFNLQGASLTEFEVSEPQLPDDTSIAVVSKTLAETIVEGSWVIFTGDKIANFITRSDSGIRLGVRGYTQAVTGGGNPLLMSVEGEEIEPSDSTLQEQNVTDSGFDVTFSPAQFVREDVEWAFSTKGDQTARNIHTESEIAILQGEVVVKARADGRLALVRLDAKPRTGSVVEIQADNINLKGLVTAINDDPTSFTEIDGGKIRATSSVVVGTGNNVAALTGAHADIRIYAGSSDPNNAPFRVLQDGSAIATKFVQLSGETVDGVIEHFSLKDLVVTGTITNENEDYSISEGGIIIKQTDFSGVPTIRAYSFSDSTGSRVAGIWHNDTTAGQPGINISDEESNKVWIKARATFNTIFRGIPILETARDAIPSPETGAIIYNSTTNRYNYYDGTQWLNF